MNRGESYLILGGGGMIGVQVVHEIARELHPRAVVIYSRELTEVEDIIEHCRSEFARRCVRRFWR